jgi:hypothetical protein
MSVDYRERSRPSRRRDFARGGAIINILTGLIFFGLLAAGVLWIMKTAGEAGKQYGDAMVNTQHKGMTLACQMNLRSIAQCLQTYAISEEKYPTASRNW